MKKTKTALVALILAALLLTACSRPAAQPTEQPAAETAEVKTEYAAPATAGHIGLAGYIRLIGAQIDEE